ncbi:MAG: PTS sorbitol transporter subunit IIB, partial [Actinomycetota bacterium]
MSAINNVIVKIGRSVGGVVGTLYQAGRDSVDTTIRNVIPFMAFISFIIGLILTTGVGDWIAQGLTGSASSLAGLLLISLVCAIPILSPLLGP